MSSNNIIPIGNPIFQAFDPTTGQFLSTGKLYVVQPGGSISQLLTIYGTVIDAENQTNAISNPVILSAQGTGFIVVTGPCKLILQNSAGSQQWVFDNFNATASNIYDSNGNALLLFTSQNNAVNEITINNSVTGTAPGISATGSDTNVGLNINLQGTATLSLNTGVGGTTAAQGNMTVGGNQTVSGNSVVTGTANVTGNIVGQGNITAGSALVGANLLLTNGSILGANSTTVQTVTAVASATNYVAVTNANAAAPSIAAAGSNTNINLQLQGKGTGGCLLGGNTAGVSTPAGNIGEILTQTTGTICSANTTTNVTTLNLTPGHWQVSGVLTTNAAGTATIGGLSTASGTFGTVFQLTTTSGLFPSIPVPILYQNVSTTTTVYLIINMAGGGGFTATGIISAQRIA